MSDPNPMTPMQTLGSVIDAAVDIVKANEMPADVDVTIRLRLLGDKIERLHAVLLELRQAIKYSAPKITQLVLLCVFAACFGPFGTVGEATNFMGAQSAWVVEHSSVIADGDGFDAVLTLKGPQKGSICAATVNGYASLCPQSNLTMNGSMVERR